MKEAILAAHRQFGEYHYYDKGAYEVMDVAACVTAIEKSTVEELKQISANLGDLMEWEHGEPFVRAVAVSCDHLPEEKFDALLSDERTAEVY